MLPQKMYVCSEIASELHLHTISLSVPWHRKKNIESLHLTLYLEVIFIEITMLLVYGKLLNGITV